MADNNNIFDLTFEKFCAEDHRNRHCTKFPHLCELPDGTTIDVAQVKWKDLSECDYKSVVRSQNQKYLSVLETYLTSCRSQARKENFARAAEKLAENFIESYRGGRIRARDVRGSSPEHHAFVLESLWSCYIEVTGRFF